MAFMDRVKKFATSPEGKKVFAEAQKVAKDPKSQQRIADVRKRLTGGGSTPKH